jgi:glycosyltransferase involved in cell wall biosynthesis
MEDQNNFNYSIIIPHKNIPELLQRCLESIPVRDDVQVIVVDDNSDPDKVDFSTFPGLNRPYTEVYFTKEGKGAGYARNVGLSKAKGKWLVFADADDFFLDGFLNYLDKYLNSSADIVFFNIKSVYSNNLKPAFRHMKVNKLIERSLSLDSVSVKKLKYSFLEPFSKLYNYNFIKKNNIQFQEVFFSNDTLFTLTAAIKDREIQVDNHPIYCVTVSNGSLTNIISRESLYTRIKVAIQANDLLVENGEAKYKIPVIPFVVMARYFGIKTVIDVIRILLRNKQNIFIGLSELLIRPFKRLNPEYRKHSRLTKSFKAMS